MRTASPGCMPVLTEAVNRLVIEPTSRCRRNRRHRSFSCCLRGSLSMRLTSLGPRRLRPRSPPAAAAAFLSPCRHVLRFSHPSHRAPSPPPPCAKPAVAAIHIGGAATAPSSAFASELCFLSHPLSILLPDLGSGATTATVEHGTEAGTAGGRGRAAVATTRGGQALGTYPTLAFDLVQLPCLTHL
jgi:hypothetical protein